MDATHSIHMAVNSIQCLEFGAMYLTSIIHDVYGSKLGAQHTCKDARVERVCERQVLIEYQISNQFQPRSEQDGFA